MMCRSWYGSATLMTTFGLMRSMSAIVCGTSSASTCAVRIGRSICAAIFRHFSSVRLASVISENTSGCCAHLCATTWPTPPAPMISTLDIRCVPPGISLRSRCSRAGWR